MSRWIGEDLFSAITATGEHLGASNSTPTGAFGSLSEGTATVMLYFTNGPQVLAVMKTQPQHFVYALDGESLLVISGALPFESAEYLTRVLGGAHAEETGIFPAR